MTDQQHPITPPPELIKQWWDNTHGAFYEFEAVATQAARWGADQELEACCSWANATGWEGAGDSLCAARRSKPQSQAEEALIALEQTVTLLMPVTGRKKIERFDVIRAALERLRELERTVAD